MNKEYAEKLAIAMGAVKIVENEVGSHCGVAKFREYELPDGGGNVEIYDFSPQESEISWFHPTFCKRCETGLSGEGWPDFRSLEWQDYIKKLVRELWCLEDSEQNIDIVVHKHGFRIDLSNATEVCFFGRFVEVEAQAWEACLFWLKKVDEVKSSDSLTVKNIKFPFEVIGKCSCGEDATMENSLEEMFCIDCAKKKIVELEEGLKNE